MKVVVIGGGIIGLATARELALGGLDVTIVDQGRIGGEASWAGGGILSPLYPWRYPVAVNRLAKWSQAHYPELADELIHEGAVDPQWYQSGLLMLDTNEAAAAMAWADAYDLPHELVTAAQCAELEPALQIPDQSAVWFPTLAQIRNPRLVKSLAVSCQQHGVVLREATHVTGLSFSGKAVVGVQTDMERLPAEVVVVASGAWSARLLNGLHIQLPVRPVRGQMIMYHAQPGQVRHINLYEGHYLIPRRDGRILVGSTLEEVDFDKSTTAQARDQLQHFACSLFPDLRNVPIETQWAGLRPGSPSGIPYICTVPEHEGVYLNTGHYRNGVVLGLASARLLADIILGREPILDAAEYGLERA
jgi:glycine oxidase